jgi:molecular chaperone GrpE
MLSQKLVKEILLLKRSKKSFNPGKWDLPGGTLEKGETLEEALLREIEEETGLEVETGEILGTAEFSKEAKQFKDEKRGLRFLAYCENVEVEISNEHQDFGWFSFGEALKKLSEKDGFENEKREAVLKAQEILEAKSAVLGWKRALADLENYKKRAVKENEDFRRYCLEDYIFSLLPVLDNFDLALKHVPKEEAKNNWIVGILHIKKQLENVLTENGVNVIEAKIGDDFDENFHEVVDGEFKKGKIQEIIKAGYKIGDKIIRPVMVKIN